MALLLQCCLCLIFIFFCKKLLRTMTGSVFHHYLHTSCHHHLISSHKFAPLSINVSATTRWKSQISKADRGSPAANPVGHHLKQKSFSNKLCFCKIFRSFGALQLSEERAKHRESITKTFFIVYIL